MEKKAGSKAIAKGDIRLKLVTRKTAATETIAETVSDAKEKVADATQKAADAVVDGVKSVPKKVELAGEELQAKLAEIEADVAENEHDALEVSACCWCLLGDYFDDLCYRLQLKKQRKLEKKNVLK